MTSWLIDKSALVRLARSPDITKWTERIQRRLVRISTLTRLEVGYSARNAEDLRVSLHDPPVASMPIEHLTPTMEDRATVVQALLADRGQHRAPSIPDLLVAAIAEISQLTVLHVDKDYELIADVTGQPIERLVLA